MVFKITAEIKHTANRVEVVRIIDRLERGDARATTGSLALTVIFTENKGPNFRSRVVCYHLGSGFSDSECIVVKSNCCAIE